MTYTVSTDIFDVFFDGVYRFHVGPVLLPRQFITNTAWRWPKRYCRSKLRMLPFN